MRSFPSTVTVDRTYLGNDERKLSLEIPMHFYQYPLQEKGLEIEIPCEQRVAGMVIYYPLSALIVEGI